MLETYYYRNMPVMIFVHVTLYLFAFLTRQIVIFRRSPAKYLKPLYTILTKDTWLTFKLCVFGCSYKLYSKELTIWHLSCRKTAVKTIILPTIFELGSWSIWKLGSEDYRILCEILYKIMRETKSNVFGVMHHKVPLYCNKKIWK